MVRSLEVERVGGWKLSRREDEEEVKRMRR